VHKTFHLGNPLRQEILDIRQVSPQQARSSLGLAPDLPLLLVTGGSQGARHLNQTVVKALPQLLRSCQVLQISGNKLFAETRELADQVLAGVDGETSQRYRLVAYMSDEMPAALQAASLLLCRAGASTLSELAALGKPSILVPLPPGIGGSPQEVNADAFGGKQAAEVIRNENLSPDILVERVNDIIISPARLQAIGEAISAFARPTATQDIVEAVLQIAAGAQARSQQREGTKV
jgi:UDP-N-acetylglucosamine--N-acetylmuramyl-(pentapeptide) pyrophosphoryl-undecaprenol N-acetylglucosamine transferase